MWERKFPVVVTLRILHLIPVGTESTAIHLAGLTRYQAFEVILASCLEDLERAQKLQKQISETGLNCRIVEIQNSYRNAYIPLYEELFSSITDEVCIAINASTGHRLLLLAAEDATVAALYENIQLRECKFVSAFRYVIEKLGDELVLRKAPIWNIYSASERAIVSTLLSRSTPASLKDIFMEINTYSGDMMGYESFRKQFRSFTKGQRSSPILRIDMERAPKYFLDV